jgi:hypothetical protein
MRVNADLNRVNAERADAFGFAFANQNGIGFELDAEGQPAGVLEKFKKILAQHDFAAAERKNENASGSKFVEEAFDLGRGHLAVVIVVEVTVDAAFIAAVSEVELNAQGNT